MQKFRLFPRAALLLAASFLLTYQAPAQTGNAKKADYKLTVRAEKQDALYAPNEPVKFAIDLSGAAGIPQSAEAKWSISKDGQQPVKSGNVVLTDGKAEIVGTLDEPGFLYCTVSLKVDGKEVKGAAAAGIDPLKIEPTTTMPEDFDAFWQEQKAQLAKIPLNIRLTPQPKLSTPEFEVFDVQADSVDGVPVSGYLTRPRDARRGSLPAIITLHGAGVRSASVNSFWAKNGFIALDINAHGLPNGKPASFYKDLLNGEMRRYVQRGREDRNESYFRGMFLRVIRGIDVLAAQPEWDGQTLVVYGSSQGGAQSIFAAGMDDRVSFIASNVPAMAEHNGVLSGRASGSWWWLETAADRQNEKMIETSRYYDSVNFARRAKAPAAFGVGFLDRTCPPTAVYAMYNTWPNQQKEMYDSIETGHGNPPAVTKWLQKKVLDHAAAQKKSQKK